MKLTRASVELRETFVRNLFRYNPTLSGTDAMKTIKSYFEVGMNPNRVYAIRNQVVNGGKKVVDAPKALVPAPVPELVVIPEAAPQPKPTAPSAPPTGASALVQPLISGLTRLPDDLAKQLIPKGTDAKGKHLYLLVV